MEYMSAKEASEKWGISVRWVQNCCKEGYIDGVIRIGKSWLIPMTATKPIVRKKNTNLPTDDISLFMPLMNGSFVSGQCQQFIETLKNKDGRTIAQAEYAYFSGHPQQTSQLVEPYLNHQYLSLRLSAYILYTFANLSLGHINCTRLALNNIQELLKESHIEKQSKEIQAVCTFSQYFASVLLHMPSPTLPSISTYLSSLPQGIRLFACYLMAHHAYLEKDYGKSLGIAQTALFLQDQIYPIPYIYIQLVIAMDLMNLKRVEEAKEHFITAWEVAKKDQLIEAFGEHHGLLQGLVETCLKKDYPKEYQSIIAITYQFSSGWRKVHNPETQEEVADNLTTLEFTIAMLASKGWTNQEIGKYLNLSLNTVKYYTTTIYRKLNITNRSHLQKFMLR